MYPLRFEPIFRRYIWGGQRLGQLLGKSTGTETAAESWEIVDHEADQSIVRFGELSGQSLRQLISDHGESLVGPTLLDRISAGEVPTQLQGRFPLLFKFLDANRDLSVQVHPDDAMGQTLSPPDLGKTEAWYVMHTDPGSKIYAGLKQGVTKDEFRLAIDQGTTKSLLHSFEPIAGDCVFIKAGTVHAIGAGLLIAEIQQASNTTFRIYDWGRVDSEGKSRELHIEQALEAIDFERGPVVPQKVDAASETTLVSCDEFEMRSHRFESDRDLGGDGKFRIIAVVKGQVKFERDPSGLPLKYGETILLPAALGKTKLMPEGSAEVLEIFVP